MTFNAKFFFDYVKAHLFVAKMKQSQVDGINAILDKWNADMPDADDRWLAYMLATVHHETGATMQPVRETFASSDDIAIARLNTAYNAGRLPWVSTPYWRRDDQGKTWLGRGYVQITHRSNYKRLGEKIGVDLLTDPNVALQTDVALKILFTGMVEGLFTGKRLGNYFTAKTEEWMKARQIINGLESANTVAFFAHHYYAAISYKK